MDKSFSGVFSAMTRLLGEETAPVWAVHDEALKRAANG